MTMKAAFEQDRKKKKFSRTLNLTTPLTPAAGYCSFVLTLCQRKVQHGPVTSWTEGAAVDCGATPLWPNPRLSDQKGLPDQTQLATWLIPPLGGAYFDGPTEKKWGKKNNRERDRKCGASYGDFNQDLIKSCYLLMGYCFSPKCNVFYYGQNLI